ncbi:division/cell wall cluster transcriptional repressor MraZ [Altericroceibacterium xinjiangense]|uniref:division/cell wall cluster transcriptional repressor MraZ n=1 Tax=Altericroceibacterium xinjiangense TaxID=762261 RepID=UPI000F7E74DC|nr:division/cell wall cluster transcriptional repressor MraZ [Altericroceibacterium xinjiangense]
MAGEQPIGYSGQAFSLQGEKSRFTLPPAFRKAVTESSGDRILCLSKHEKWPCLTGFGLSRRSALEAQIDREEERALRLGRDFDRDLRALQLYGFSELPFDASGRFVMPEHLAELGQMDRGVYFQGAGAFFTLWNPEELYRMGEGWEGAQAACRQLEAEALAKGKKG